MNKKNILETLTSIQDKATKVAKSPDLSTSSADGIANDLEKFTDIFGYGSGKDSMTKEETIGIGKYIKTVKSLEWMWTVVESYPHNVIGRYPIQINGKDPITVYHENKDSLWKFIQKIKYSCLQIKENCK